MFLSKILFGLHNYSRKWIQCFDRDLDILSLAILKKGELPEPNVLYFGYTSDLPLKKTSGMMNLLCIQNSSIPDIYTDPSEVFCNLVIIDQETDYNLLLSILLDSFGVAAKIGSGRSKLIDILHRNEGMQKIVDTASGILGNPVIVVDSGYKILAMTAASFSPSGRDDLEEQRQLGFMLKSNIDAMNRAHLYEQAREKRYPIYSKGSSDSHGWITALIYIHGIEVGQVGVMDSEHSFSESDFEIIDFLCKVLSLELQKSDFYRTSQGLMHSYFLSDLLDNQLQDENAIHERMQALGWDLGETLRIMVISDSKRNFFEGKAQLITRQLMNTVPNSRWLIYRGQIVFLLNAPAVIDEHLRESLQKYLIINHLNASISNYFSNIMDIQRHYRQAQIADRYGHRLHPEETIHLYSDYIFYHMADSVEDKETLENFYHHGVVALREYDRQHNTAFLETLKLYLTYIDRPDEIAERLYVHKNTVFYRINKIKEQFHLELNNGEERFRIHMTLKLMELEN